MKKVLQEKIEKKKKKKKILLELKK